MPKWAELNEGGKDPPEPHRLPCPLCKPNPRRRAPRLLMTINDTPYSVHLACVQEAVRLVMEIRGENPDD